MSKSIKFNPKETEFDHKKARKAHGKRRIERKGKKTLWEQGGDDEFLPR